MPPVQVLAYGAGAETAPAPAASARRPARIGWLARRRAAAREQRKTVALLCVTAGDLRAPGDRKGMPEDMPSPRQQRALLSAANFFLRAQASQLEAIGRSGVVVELVRILTSLAVSSERPMPERSPSLDGCSHRAHRRRLRAPKQLALGLSAIANLLFIGGYALADRARVGPVLIELLQYDAHAEVQSYALACLQNLSASAVHAGALVGRPGLLDALHDLAITLPDGDQRFYYAAGAYANLIKLGVAHALRSEAEGSRAWWRVKRAGESASASAIKAGLHAADEAVESMMRRREAIRLVQQVTVTQRRWRATQVRVRFVRMRAAARVIQVAARERRLRRRLQAVAFASAAQQPASACGDPSTAGVDAARPGATAAQSSLGWAYGRAPRAPFSRADSGKQLQRGLPEFHDIFTT